MKDNVRRLLYNLTTLRLLLPPARLDLSGNLRWRDIPYCCLRTWRTVIPALWRREKIPAGVMLVGDWITKEDMDWAVTIAEKLGVDKK